MNLFVVAEVFYPFSCRSLTRPAWHTGLFSSRWIIVGISAQAIGQLAISYLPAMHRGLRYRPDWRRRVAAKSARRVVVSPVVVVDKWLRRRA